MVVERLLKSENALHSANERDNTTIVRPSGLSRCFSISHHHDI